MKVVQWENCSLIRYCVHNSVILSQEINHGNRKTELLWKFTPFEQFSHTKWVN